MEDGKTDTQERADGFPAPVGQPRRRHRSGEILATFSSYWLDYADIIIYVIIGTAFLIGALCALGYSFWNFYLGMAGALSKGGTGISAVAPDIIQFVSDLLLVLIIMEVLSTVLHYLKSHTASLRPFLFIGIVSATRGILSIGARLSVGGVNIGSEFNHDMIELGVNAAVVLVLGITIKLLGKQTEDEPV